VSCALLFQEEKMNKKLKNIIESVKFWILIIYKIFKLFLMIIYVIWLSLKKTLKKSIKKTFGFIYLTFETCFVLFTFSFKLAVGLLKNLFHIKST